MQTLKAVGSMVSNDLDGLQAFMFFVTASNFQHLIIKVHGQYLISWVWWSNRCNSIANSIESFAWFINEHVVLLYSQMIPAYQSKVTLAELIVLRLSLGTVLLLFLFFFLLFFFCWFLCFSYLQFLLLLGVFLLYYAFHWCVACFVQ